MPPVRDDFLLPAWIHHCESQRDYRNNCHCSHHRPPDDPPKLRLGCEPPQHTFFQAVARLCIRSFAQRKIQPTIDIFELRLSVVSVHTSFLLLSATSQRAAGGREILVHGWMSRSFRVPLRLRRCSSLPPM